MSNKEWLLPSFAFDMLFLKSSKSEFKSIFKGVLAELPKKFKNVIGGSEKEPIKESLKELQSKLFEGKNTCLFYQGLENDIEDSHLIYKSLIMNKYFWLFKNDDEYYEGNFSFYTAKTDLKLEGQNKGKTKRLLSILLEVYGKEKNDYSSPIRVLYILFPIGFDDYHEK